MVFKVPNVIFVFLLLCLLLGANFVYALEINYPRVPGADPPQDFLTKAPSEDILSLYVKYFVYLFIWIGGFLAIIMLISGGLGYLMSSGSPEKMVNAKQQILGAFLGLLILFSIYLILNTISPSILQFKMPTLTSIKTPEPPDLPELDTTRTDTSIDIEIPFGRIIESIFETYDFTNHPDKRDKEYVPRMLRITNNIRAVVSDDHKVGLADMLLEQSIGLKNLANKCSCRDTEPVNPCGRIKSGDTTWQCGCFGCGLTKPVSCDPCASVRSEIQNTEEKNINAIYDGTNIKQLDKDLETATITTGLTQEIIKTEKEVSLLKEELDKLKRSEKFISECSARSLKSWTQFIAKDDEYKNSEKVLRNTKFWDNINIKYYPKEYGFFYTGPILFTDYATFYCSVSGTAEQEESFPISAPSEDDLTETMTIKEIEVATSQSMSCPTEAPVGEIIDRTKRTTQLLIDKLGTLVSWEKKLIDAVDKLQILISQCSSQRGCERRCSCFSDLCDDYPGCRGWAFSCADSSPAYPGACLDRDEDTPCPYKEIDEQIKKIEKIYQEIADIIEGKEDKDTPDAIGIINIIDEIVPGILNDMEKNIRATMKDCSTKNIKNTALFKADYAEGSYATTGQIGIKCQIFKKEADGTNKLTAYGQCFEECYLEKTQNEHRKCVQKCLDKSGDEELKKCTNELNFYCCNI